VKQNLNLNFNPESRLDRDALGEGLVGVDVDVVTEGHP